MNARKPPNTSNSSRKSHVLFFTNVTILLRALFHWLSYSARSVQREDLQYFIGSERFLLAGLWLRMSSFDVCDAAILARKYSVIILVIPIRSLAIEPE